MANPSSVGSDPNIRREHWELYHDGSAFVAELIDASGCTIYRVSRPTLAGVIAAARQRPSAKHLRRRHD